MLGIGLHINKKPSSNVVGITGDWSTRMQEKLILIDPSEWPNYDTLWTVDNYIYEFASLDIDGDTVPELNLAYVDFLIFPGIYNSEFNRINWGDEGDDLMTWDAGTSIEDNRRLFPVGVHQLGTLAKGKIFGSSSSRPGATVQYKNTGGIVYSFIERGDVREVIVNRVNTNNTQHNLNDSALKNFNLSSTTGITWLTEHHMKKFSTNQSFIFYRDGQSTAQIGNASGTNTFSGNTTGTFDLTVVSNPFNLFCFCISPKRSYNASVAEAATYIRPMHLGNAFRFTGDKLFNSTYYPWSYNISNYPTPIYG